MGTYAASLEAILNADVSGQAPNPPILLPLWEIVAAPTERLVLRTIEITEGIQSGASTRYFPIGICISTKAGGKPLFSCPFLSDHLEDPLSYSYLAHGWQGPWPTYPANINRHWALAVVTNTHIQRFDRFTIDPGRSAIISVTNGVNVAATCYHAIVEVDI